MKAFHDLYERYAAHVFCFAMYLSGDRDLAEDLTSETFLRVWTAAEEPRLATVKAYLFTIARNLYLQSLRAGSRRTSLSEDIFDSSLGPEARAEIALELGAVAQAMQTLPEIDRAALLMRAVEGLPYKEIAVALRLSTAAVRVKVHRARIKLARICRQEE